MLESYLSKLSNTKKNKFLNKAKNNSQFYNFLVNCSKLNIDIFDECEEILKNNLLIEKLNELKVLYIKKFGIEIYENYSKNVNNALELIDVNNKKLKIKIKTVDNIINYLKRNSKFGINYSERYEYIEFDNTLFVISDENIDIENNIENLDSDKNSPYIAEYSN